MPILNTWQKAYNIVVGLFSVPQVVKVTNPEPTVKFATGTFPVRKRVTAIKFAYRIW